MIDTRGIPEKDLPLEMYKESKESWNEVYYAELNELKRLLSYLEYINRIAIKNVAEPTWHSLNRIQETASHIFYYAEDIKHLIRIKPFYEENKNEG